MERKELLKKISGIETELLAVQNMLVAIGSVSRELFPEYYESLTVEAAVKMEKITCNIRHLVYATLNITKRKLMKKAAGVHEIEINYSETIFTVTLPALLPKKKKPSNSEFITDPLYIALEEYFIANDVEIFGECVVAFEHIYDENTPSRRICDYDNLELKSVLDTVSAFVMTDDGGKYCDVFHMTGYAGKDCTKISVMTKNKFKEWVKNRENTVSENI
jgi:hypothetical protein